MRSLILAFLLLAASTVSAQQVVLSDAAEADGTRMLAHEIVIPGPRGVAGGRNCRGHA